MKVKDLKKILKECPDEMEIHIKWMNAISSLTLAEKKKVARDRDNRKECDNRKGKVEVLLMSPFDVEIGGRDY